MDFLFTSGIHLILQLQTQAWLAAPMRFFTFLGTEEFFILVLPIVYWCIDAEAGIQIGLILLVSQSLNEIAKLALMSPRPYWVSGQVKALAAEYTFGAPSSHAQNAVGVWGTIAAHIDRRWAWMGAALLIFLIGLSRIYLAVHFPQDVAIGWLLGILILGGCLSFWARGAGWLKKRSPLQQILAALLVAGLLILADGLLVQSLKGYRLPPEWLMNAQRAGEPLPAPVSMEGIFASTGVLLGLALGLVWIRQRGGFQPSGPIWKRAACFFIGLAGLLTLYVGLKAIFPQDGTLWGDGLRLLRYLLIGLWVAGGAPYVFLRFNLIENSDR